MHVFDDHRWRSRVAVGLGLLGVAACGRTGMDLVSVIGDSSESSSGTTTGLDTSGTVDTSSSHGTQTSFGPTTDTFTATGTDTFTETETETETDTSTTETTDEPPAVCGNGIVEAGEQCDPGEAMIGPEQACVPGCLDNVCGDGMAGPAEECDDGNGDDDDACQLDCTRPRAVAVAMGGNHACVLVDNGSVRCWGNGNNGRTGYGAEDNIGDDEPVSAAGVVSLVDPVSEVIAGIGHTCVRYAGGAVRCFGRAAEGQLGYGNLDDIGDDEVPGAVPPVLLGGASQGLSTGSASFHGCSIMTGGTVRCWGASGNGRLGVPGLAQNIGDDEPAGDVPTVLAGGLIVEVSTGAEHTCARFSGGELRCWGGNASGQLGLGQPGQVGDDEDPSTVGPIAIGGTAIQVSAGWFHTCVLLDSGDVRCWGRGNDGRLGYGNTTWLGLTSTPAEQGVVSVGGTVVEIAAGNAHTCARLDSGAVRCWGWGGQGQLGYGNPDSIGDDELPSSAGDVPLGGTAVQIAVGSNQSCALLTTGQVRCWGNGGDGRLGYGNLDNVGDDETPALVGDVPLFPPE